MNNSTYKFENLCKKAAIIKIIRGYGEQFNINKFFKLDEMDKSLEKHILPKWTLEQMKKLHSCIYF